MQDSAFGGTPGLNTTGEEDEDDFLAVWQVFRKVLQSVGLSGHLGGVTDARNMASGINDEFVRWIVERPTAEYLMKGDAFAYE